MTEARNAGMNEFWNGAGGQAWMSFEDRLEASLSPLGDRAIAAATIKASESVLDVGCGCGGTSIKIARKVGDRGRVQGVDISRSLLIRAEANAESAGVRNLGFADGDAQVYPFPDDHYDLAFSRFGVMFFDDPVAAFTNIYRALKPGGRLAFICWQTARQNAWVSRPLAVVARHIPLPPPPAPDEPGPFSLSDKDRVFHILSAAGFVGTAIEHLELPFILGSNPEQAVQFLMQLSPSGGAITRAGVDEVTRANIARDMLELCNTFATNQGVAMASASTIVTAQKP